MTKYITLQIPTYVVYSIIEVENIDTLDGIELPDDVLQLLPASHYEVLPEIGQTYNPETNQFQ
jgi:hypothetical protein